MQKYTPQRVAFEAYLQIVREAHLNGLSVNEYAKSLGFATGAELQKKRIEEMTCELEKSSFDVYSAIIARDIEALNKFSGHSDWKLDFMGRAKSESHTCQLHDEWRKKYSTPYVGQIVLEAK